MAAGGKRSGAGRPKGSIDPVTVQRREAADKAVDLGITPLEYMLTVLRDAGLSMAERMDAAKAAAPYIHAKLAAATVTLKNDENTPFAFTVILGSQASTQAGTGVPDTSD